HGCRPHGARAVRRRVPGGAGRARGRARPAVRRRRLRSRLLERGRRARCGWSRRPAAFRPRAVPRCPACVRHDAEQVVSARGAHTAPACSLAAGLGPRTRDPVRRRPRPARPEGVRVALSLRGACTQSRHDARRRRPRMSWRRPVWALYALVGGLALHNIVMAMLWRAGVRGGTLTVISAWKEVLLLAALVLVVAERRALPFSR